MKIAPTYIAGFLALLAPILARHGVIIDTDTVASAIWTLITVLAPLFIMARQWWLGRSTLVGTKPN